VAAEAASQGRVERNILADLTKYFPSNLLPGAGYLVGIFVFTRWFVPASYGWLVLASAAVTPVIGLSTQWILRPAMRYYAEYQRAGQGVAYTAALASFTAWMCLLAVLASALAAIPLALSGWLSAHAVLASGEFAFVIGSVPNTVALSVLRSGLRAGMFFALSAIAEVVAIGFPLLMVRTVSHDIGWLAWGQALAVLVVLPYVLRTTGLTPGSIRIRFTQTQREVLIRFVRYGGPMAVWYVGASLLTVEGRYVLQLFRGSRDLAVYGVNFDFITAVAAVLNGTIVLGFGPALFHHWAQGGRAEVTRAISDATDLYLMLGLAFVGGVLVVGPYVESVLIGPKYRVGVEFLVPAAVAMVFFGLSLIGHKCLELGEGTGAIASSAIWAGLLNLALNLVFVPFYGYEASVCVAAVSYGLYTAFIWLQARSLAASPNSTRSVWGFPLGRGVVPGALKGRTIVLGAGVMAEQGPSTGATVPWVFRMSGLGRALVAAAVSSYAGLAILRTVDGGPLEKLVVGVGAYVIVWAMACGALGFMPLAGRAG